MFLTAQLKDIAYGTKTHVFRAEVTEQDVADEFDETVHLERGENLLEIHIARASLTPAALETLGDPEPSTFCTFAFYDFQLQATPVVRGRCPAYGFTSQHTVRVDELFLQYLQRNAVTLELQLARGLDYQTVAACQLRLHQMLDHSGKVFGTAPLVGERDFRTQLFSFRFGPANADAGVASFSLWSVCSQYISPGIMNKLIT